MVAEVIANDDDEIPFSIFIGSDLELLGISDDITDLQED